jgi:hypothetical protein
MKKLLLVFAAVILVGCTTAQIPQYLQDKKPYIQRFYADYEDTLEVTHEALKQLGWKVEQTADPHVFEQQGATNDLNEKQILIFTEVRQTPLFVGTRYAKMNIFIRSKGKLSEVEIRYLTVNSLPLKNFQSYQNKSAADRVFDCIAGLLKKKI